MCGQKLGLLSREHTCVFCGNTLCNDCAIKFHIDTDSYAEICAFDYSIHTEGWSFDQSKLSEKLHRGWTNPYAYACPSCYRTMKSQEQTMIQNANEIGVEHVRLYSHRYQGRIPQHTKEISVKTPYYKDRSEAEMAMKAIAAYLGCRNVIKVRYNRDTDEDGNYKFSIFQYEGIGIK
jgi:transcription elongation factor Elf1